MKTIYFTIFFVGYLIMLIAIFISNIYLLGLAELLIIVPTILLIKLKYSK